MTITAFKAKKLLSKTWTKTLELNGSYAGEVSKTLELLFEPRDLWIGVFWDVPYSPFDPFWQLEIYLCIIPCLPLHFCVDRRDLPF